MQEACHERRFRGRLENPGPADAAARGALFVDPNPAGPKYALSVLGKLANELRLPMLPAASTAQAAIKAAMTHAGLLSP